MWLLGEGWLLFGLAAGLAVAGVALIDRRAPAPSDAAAEPAPAPAPLARGLGLALVGAAVLITVAVTALVVARQAAGLTDWLWLVALLVVTVGVALAEGSLAWPRWRRLSHAGAIELAGVLAIVGLTLALRLPDLASLPPDVHGDEAWVGSEARRIFQGQVPSLVGVGWTDIPLLSFALQVPFLWPFGDGLYGLRLASVAQGTLSVLLLYLLARRLFSVRVAAVAAVLMAVSQWHIHFSRIGTSYMQGLLATVLLAYLVVRAAQRGRALDYLLAGFAAGLCLEVYFAARLAPLLAGLYLLHRGVGERGLLRRQWPGLLALALGAAIFLAPLAGFLSGNARAFMTRTEGVWIFTPSNLAHLYQAHQTDRIEDVVRVQVINSLTAFNLRGESSLQYGRRGPLLDFVTGALFVPGLALATLRLRRSRYFVPAIWFWLTLLFGGILTVDALSSLRTLGMVPAIMLLAALVLDAGWRGLVAVAGPVGRYGATALLGLALLLAGRANVVEYFEHHVVQAAPASFATILSRYILSINDRYRVYLISRPDITLRHETTTYLVPDLDGVDVRDQPLPLPLDHVPAAKGVVFVVTAEPPEVARRLDAIEQAYPGGQEQRHDDALGRPQFVSYQVEREELLAARPDASVDDAAISGLLRPPGR